MIFYIIVIVLIGLLSAFFLRSEYERRHPVLTEYEVFSEKIPEAFDGYRIAYLADLHGCRFGKGNENLRKTLENFSCDAVFLGGDMVSYRGRELSDIRTLSDTLSLFPKGIPYFYGLGNHECGILNEGDPEILSALRDLFRDYGIRVLDNEGTEILRGSEKIFLAGISLPDKYYKAGRKKSLTEPEILSKIERMGNGYRMVLCHTPLYLREVVNAGSDLVFSGHFHGGTIRIPGLGGVMTPQYQFFYQYTAGKFDLHGGTGIVTTGLGTHSINIRFLCRAEIVAVTLRRGKNGS